MSHLLFDKLAPLFVYPLGLAIICLILLTLLGMRRRSFRVAGLVVLVGLWCATTPLLSSAITRSLERQCAARSLDETPAQQAIVLLGGIVSGGTMGGEAAEFGDAIDRLWSALRLYRAGKAPLIIVSGGNLPWNDGIAEAEQLKALLVELGVPGEAIRLDALSRNTWENAVNTAAIFAEMKLTSGILVTSAMHMPRAAGSFRAAGLELLPYPTDFRGRRLFFESVLDFLPDAESLASTTRVIKEHIGYWVYLSRGWLEPPNAGAC